MSGQESMGTDAFNKLRGRVPDAKVQGIDAGRLSFWLPKLDRTTHPNAQGPSAWRKKAKAKKAQKEAAWITAKSVMGLAKPWKTATVKITYFTSAARCDRDNILSWCKNSFDGFQGVIIDNDSGFTHEPVTIERVKRSDSRAGLIWLVVTKTS